MCVNVIDNGAIQNQICDDTLVGFTQLGPDLRSNYACLVHNMTSSNISKSSGDGNYSENSPQIDAAKDSKDLIMPNKESEPKDAADNKQSHPEQQEGPADLHKDSGISAMDSVVAVRDQCTQANCNEQSWRGYIGHQPK